MDLSEFASAVGSSGPVSIVGLGTRGGHVPGCRVVAAPSGIVDYNPAEMTMRCGAGTSMDEVFDALRAAGQTVALAPGGTVGGVLATAASDIRRLGRGPARDALLQARIVTADGLVAKAGGPTVKNVSGFDLCRLLVGSHGALGFFGDVILRTRPAPAVSRWFAGSADPDVVRARLYRPAAVLWDGRTTWICLEGHPADVADQAALTGLPEVDAPPTLPPYAWSVAMPDLRRVMTDMTAPAVAEFGVGVIHASMPQPARSVNPAVFDLHRSLAATFDPTGRLNPGRFPLLLDTVTA
jgi:glycolate oxidase FAD binding subunit